MYHTKSPERRYDLFGHRNLTHCSRGHVFFSPVEAVNDLFVSERARMFYLGNNINSHEHIGFLIKKY